MAILFHTAYVLGNDDATECYPITSVFYSVCMRYTGKKSWESRRGRGILSGMAVERQLAVGKRPGGDAG
jgi:hypothetical protein